MHGSLASLLHFTGVELLFIDTEGHDCQILQSVIDYCRRPGCSGAWPDVICFETMGHCDKVHGPSTEQSMLDTLRMHDYLVVFSGHGV